MTQDILQAEIINHSYEMTDTLAEKPVDLFVRVPGGNSLCMEVKLGGDLDTSNAPAQLAKLLTTCALADVPNLEGYFTTIYNKNGEGKRFTGIVASYLAGDMILAGSDFWVKILPPDMAFGDFVRLYHQALREIGINDAIRDMVKSLVPTTKQLQVKACHISWPRPGPGARPRPPT